MWNFIIIPFYIVYVVVAFFFSIYDEWKPLTITGFYHNWGVNWFGAIILYLLCIIINPIWLICSWVYLLFTIGRKD